MNVPVFPDLDGSSDDGSRDSSDGAGEAAATPTIATIKPGGEDNDPIVPMRSVSPTPPRVDSKSSASKLSSHRKMSQKTRLANPLDAFDKSPPEAAKKPATMDSTPSANPITAAPASAATPGKYGYEAAEPTRRNRSPPPQSMSSGAAKALRRGVPAAAARGLNGGGGGNGSPNRVLRRPMPSRSNLKKSSSFNVGDRKSLLKAKAAAADGNQSEPTRGVARRASMGSEKTTTIEVRVRGERFPVQRRRSINFDQRVEIKEVEPVTNMVEKSSEIWLQEEDFAKMKADRRNLVHKLKKQQLSQQQKNATNGNAAAAVNNILAEPETASVLRGLEKYVDKSIRAAKNLAWDTVLLEQDEQELSGDYNEERIADLYRHFTRESPDKALARAKQDQEEIQDYLWSPRTTKLMLRRLPPSIPPSSEDIIEIHTDDDDDEGIVDGGEDVAVAATATAESS